MQIAWNEIPKSLEHLAYALEPLVTGILMTNILQFSYYSAHRNRSGTHWEKWSPVYLILVANIFVMTMPLAVLFIYVGEVGYPGSKMWKGGSWFPNQPHGIFFYILKWVGMICLIIGVCQITQLHVKIRNKWQMIRYRDGVHADEDADCTAGADEKAVVAKQQGNGNTLECGAGG